MVTLSDLRVEESTHLSSPTLSRSGFSLVEVSLAILVVGLGLLAVFGLFPFGLQASEDSVADTHAALFAEYVFNGMRSKAAEVQGSDWNNIGNLQNRLPEDLQLGGKQIGYRPGGAAAADWVEFPEGSGQFLQYTLSIEPGVFPDTCAARLKVWEGKSGATDPAPVEFYTEFCYTGM